PPVVPAGPVIHAICDDFIRAGRAGFSLHPDRDDCRCNTTSIGFTVHKETGMSKQSAARRLIGRWTGKLLAIGLVWSAAATFAAPQAPTPAQILAIKPKCEDVSISTPAPADIAGCKLDIVKTQGGGSGFVLTDKDGKTLRRFMDVSGGGR